MPTFAEVAEMVQLLVLESIRPFTTAPPVPIPKLLVEPLITAEGPKERVPPPPTANEKLPLLFTVTFPLMTFVRAKGTDMELLVAVKVMGRFSVLLPLLRDKEDPETVRALPPAT